MDAGIAERVARTLRTGEYDGHLGFVPAHFHTAEELHAELRAAGLAEISVYGVEGPVWPALDVAGNDAFDAHVEAALHSARLVERDALLVNASAHLLAVARG